MVSSRTLFSISVLISALDGVYQQLHQAFDFLFGAVPVFGGERVEREVLHAELAAALRHIAHSLNGIAMPEDAQRALLLPTFRCHPL